jgi:hypothetical protein
MGQFKPMVKMETTEPSVILKLKKGGSVTKKADGGMMGSPMGAMPPPMPARGGMPGGMPPMKPSLAMRRRAMKGLPSGAGPAGPIGGAAAMQASMPPPAPMAPPMKKGGKAEGGESKAMHKSEMKAIKGVKSDLKTHAGKAASKGHKGLATGGVVNGQGGFATGGVAKANGGGYKKGGKIKGMMDGGMAGSGMMGNGMMNDGMMNEGMPAYSAYKKGGAPKKAYAAGGTVNSGRPVAMPQGSKPASKPVRINELAGTYKKGGKVTPAEGRLLKASAGENAASFRAAKKDTNQKYGPASMMKLKGGGTTDLSKGAYDKSIGPDEDDMSMARSIRGFPGKVFSKVKDVAKDLFSSGPKADSVTKTKESVTVTPAKKSGGSVKC